MNPKQMTILHVEDDPMLALLVQRSFESFGFQGDILKASLISEAFALLSQIEHEKASLDLILLDMQLPDGNGLDVLRHVKASPIWRKTPVIVLSGEMAPDIINEAYALGANCYLPKHSRTKEALGPIQALYHCWTKEALLPQTSFADQVWGTLAKGVRLRARTAQFYLGLAQACSADSEQEAFWLERAMIEGNMSNLLAFFQGQISDQDVPSGMAERSADMQLKVEETLSSAEAFLTTQSSPAPVEICEQVLDLVEAWDEEVFAEAFGALFPSSPAITMALKARAVGQLRALASYVLKQSREPELCRRSDALLGFAGRLAAMSRSTDCTM